MVATCLVSVGAMALASAPAMALDVASKAPSSSFSSQSSGADNREAAVSSKGAISLRLAGLTSAAVPAVVVTGPKQTPRAKLGYRAVVRRSMTLAGLVPGTYKVTAANAAAGGRVFGPTAAVTMVRVLARRTTPLVISYKLVPLPPPVPRLAFVVDEAHVDSWSRVRLVFSSNQDNPTLPKFATVYGSGVPSSVVQLTCVRITKRKASCAGVGMYSASNFTALDLRGVSAYPVGANATVAVGPSFPSDDGAGQQVVTVEAAASPRVHSVSLPTGGTGPLRFSVDPATVPADIGSWNSAQGELGSPSWPGPATVSIFRGHTPIVTYNTFWTGSEGVLSCSPVETRLDCVFGGVGPQGLGGATTVPGETLRVRLSWSEAAFHNAAPGDTRWASLVETDVTVPQAMSMSNASITSSGRVTFTLTAADSSRGNPSMVIASNGQPGMAGIVGIGGTGYGGLSCTPWSANNQMTCTGRLGGVSGMSPVPFSQPVGTQLTLTSSYGTPNQPEDLTSQVVHVSADAS